MPDASAAAPPTAAIPYLCVCGALAPVRPAAAGEAGGGVCPNCGRHYGAAVLEEAGAETLCVPAALAGLVRDPPPPAAGPFAPDPGDAGPDRGESPDWNATAPLPDPSTLFDDLLPDPAVAPVVERGDDPGEDRGDDPAETLPLSGTGRKGRGFQPGELPVGTELEHFRIEAPLGRGGMGAVYRALDLSLERFVAVKVIRPDRARRKVAPGDAPSPDQADGRAGSGSAGSGSVALDRLLQEARAQARVDHPNVAHVYFVSPDPDKPFLAMELVDGPTLADVLKRGPLPYGAATRVGAEIAAALACAAKYDIVHGDVKPSNVLLAGARGDGPGRIGTVKLSDFGLARRGGRARVGGLEGTPNYLAPEVVRGGAPTAQSDLYALGVTLFETTFGRLPYTTPRQGLAQRLGAHLTNAPEFPDPWPAHLPPGWRGLLAQLLEKDPADRPACAAEFARAIRRLAPQSGTPAGLLVRAMGALTDLALALAASLLLFLAVALPGFVAIDRHVPLAAALVAAIPLALLAKAAGCAPSLLLAWWQGRGRRTPGKQLFQVRVVDRYGLEPAGRTLFLRGLAQTLPVWGFVLSLLAEDLTGQAWLEQSLALFVLTLWAIDTAASLVSKKSLTLHDRLLGTRVVLDTAARPPADPESG